MESVLESKVENTEGVSRKCKENLPIDASTAMARLVNEFRHRYENIINNMRYLRDEMKKLKKIRKCGIDDWPDMALKVEMKIHTMTIYCSAILDDITKTLMDINRIYSTIERADKTETGNEIETDAENCEKKPYELDLDLWFATDLITTQYMEKYGEVMDSLERLKKYNNKLEVIKECGYDKETRPINYIRKQIDGMRRNIAYAIRDLNSLLVDINQAQAIVTTRKKELLKTGGGS